MILTHESTNDLGDASRVYRDKTSSPRIAVIHDCAHRGGCLYLGPVTVLNQDTGQSFTFSSTSAPSARKPPPPTARGTSTRSSDQEGPPAMQITLAKDKETKNTVRYATADEEAAISQVYVDKAAAKALGDTITITIQPA